MEGALASDLDELSSELEARVSRLEASANQSAEAGDLQAAAALFRQAASLQPRATLLEPLSQCLLELGQYADAVEAARQAVHISPEWADGWLTLARANLNHGRFADAVLQFRRASELDAAVAEQAAEDLATAERLLRLEDEKELFINQSRILLRQWRIVSGGADDSGRAGTGTMLWECGIVLAKLLERQSSYLHGAAGPAAPLVLELGSGVGVAGLAAAALGAQVLLTDLPEVSNGLLTENVGLNSAVVQAAGGGAEVEALDWAAADELPARAKRCEVVLGADLLFQPAGPQLATLCGVLRRLLPPNEERQQPARLLLAHKARHEALDREMHAQMRDVAGLVLHEIPHAQHHPDYRSPNIKVFLGVLLADARNGYPHPTWSEEGVCLPARPPFL